MAQAKTPASDDTRPVGQEQRKHTPGPWAVATAGLTDEGVRFVINGAGDAVCRLQSRPLGEEMTANARLIAAAPAMGDAIEAAVVNAQDVDGRSGVYIEREQFNDLIAALARAGR